jgi:hypothetical protein
MQQQPSDAEAQANLETVIAVAGCTREAAAATMSAFGNDMDRAVDWLSRHNGQPPPSASPSPAADPRRLVDRIEAQFRSGSMPVDSSRFGQPSGFHPPSGVDNCAFTHRESNDSFCRSK